MQVHSPFTGGYAFVVRKNVRPRARSLSVLTGAAGSDRFCVPVLAWPLDWCRFVLAPVLYSSGAFANVMGFAVAARPWFKVLWLNLRRNLLQAGGAGMRTCWPNGKQEGI